MSGAACGAVNSFKGPRGVASGRGQLMGVGGGGWCELAMTAAQIYGEVRGSAHEERSITRRLKAARPSLAVTITTATAPWATTAATTAAATTAAATWLRIRHTLASTRTESLLSLLPWHRVPERAALGAPGVMWPPRQV